MNWIESTLHGGVTAMISAGEAHTPGRPRDVVGLKAMAVFPSAHSPPSVPAWPRVEARLAKTLFTPR